MSKPVKTTAFLVLFMVMVTFAYSGLIEKDRLRWKPFYKDIVPQKTVTQWLVPFKTRNRSNVKTIRVISVFGANRMSYLRGHKHSGTDMIPAGRQGTYTYVYPMADGVICSIHLGDPHTTIVVKHRLEDGKEMFTSYKHLGEIYVKNGLHVTTETRLGRLYTAKEARKLGGNYHHLHLEVRKKFDDYGVASWASLSREQLNLRFHDPHQFMKTHIK